MVISYSPTPAYNCLDETSATILSLLPTPEKLNPKQEMTQSLAEISPLSKVWKKEEKRKSGSQSLHNFKHVQPVLEEKFLSGMRLNLIWIQISLIIQKVGKFWSLPNIYLQYCKRKTYIAQLNTVFGEKKEIK